MLMNPGGPGASGVDFLRSSGQTVFTETLRDRFDIVGFDPRGVGASDPVTCLNGSAMDRLNALDPTPDDKAESDALIAGAHEFADSCQRNSGELLPHVATADAARDMDRIREALGEDEAHLFRLLVRDLPRNRVRRAVPGPRAGARSRRRHRSQPGARAAAGDAGEGVSTTPSTPSSPNARPT